MDGVARGTFIFPLKECLHMLMSGLFKFPLVQICHTLQMITSAMGTQGGCLGFIAFMFHYHNQTTAIWVIGSGCMEAAMLLLCVMYAVMERTKVSTASQYNLNNDEDPSSTTKSCSGWHDEFRVLGHQLQH